MMVPSAELARPLEVAQALALGVVAASAAAEPHALPLTAATASVCDSASGAAEAAGAVEAWAKSSPSSRANNTSSA